LLKKVICLPIVKEDPDSSALNFRHETPFALEPTIHQMRQHSFSPRVFYLMPLFLSPHPPPRPPKPAPQRLGSEFPHLYILTINANTVPESAPKRTPPPPPHTPFAGFLSTKHPPHKAPTAEDTMDMDCASAETLVHPASLLTQASSLPPNGRSDHMQRTDAPLCRFAPATDVMQQCRQSMSAEGADIATEERRISMDLRARQ